MPDWLRRPIADRVSRGEARRAVAGLHTVCEEARCPNRGVCSGRDRTATFLLMGPGCSRDCRFCSVASGPVPLDADEPAKVARAAAAMGLKYVVLTSTTRDDLPDGGAAHFAATIEAVREEAGALVEVLVPDFGGREESVDRILRAEPAVFGHNVETVPRLYPEARPASDYGRSLGVLARAAAAGVVTKSALMLGLGESEAEVHDVFRDLLSVGVRALAVGQYLRPGKDQLPVARYWTPGEFDGMAAAARDAGFAAVACAPYVRSSYRAAEVYEECLGAV